MDMLNTLADADGAVQADSTPEEVARFEQEVRDALQRKLVFLLTGRTGVGKSSTINYLLGQNVAPVGDFEPETITVSRYEARIHEIACTVFDTPGLCDDL